MFRFALKNLAVKKVQVILIVISIVISAGVAVLAFNTAEQVSEGIKKSEGNYSLIIGPSGSATQLAMNTMYFVDDTLGTIPYELVSEISQNTDVRNVVPFAMADNFNSHPVVGTSADFLADKKIGEGKMFDDCMQVVLGAKVAKEADIQVGDTVYTSHSATEQHSTGVKVVGILAETYSSFDTTVFTDIETLWELHEQEEEGEEHGEEEEHDHEEMSGMVCAILIQTKNLAGVEKLISKYNGKTYTDGDGESFSLQAIIPAQAIRTVLEDADSTKYIVYVLCAIILLMNIMVISIITLLNMYHSAKEIKLMRLIGISMKRINLLYLIENGLIGLISVLLALGISRVFLLFMRDYVAQMGVVLNFGKVYPLEFVILFAVFLISVLPTLICTAVLSRKDSLAD